jgi:hypothetical protein
VTFEELGETGRSCRKPIELRRDRFYRLHLAGAKSEPDGTRWTASISEEQASGNPTEYVIASILAPANITAIIGDSIQNFSEYFGPAVFQRSQVPISALYVSPPQANKNVTVRGRRVVTV